jgi:hypothetical protein
MLRYGSVEKEKGNKPGKKTKQKKTQTYRKYDVKCLVCVRFLNRH